MSSCQKKAPERISVPKASKAENVEQSNTSSLIKIKKEKNIKVELFVEEKLPFHFILRLTNDCGRISSNAFTNGAIIELEDPNGEIFKQEMIANKSAITSMKMGESVEWGSNFNINKLRRLTNREENPEGLYTYKHRNQFGNCGFDYEFSFYYEKDK